MLAFGQSGCIRLKKVLLEKRCCIRAKVVEFGQKWLYSGENGSIRAKAVVLREKWLYSGEMVVIGQKLLFSGKEVVIGQK